MPVNTDNPAGRLLVLLRQAKSYPNVSTCLHVWAQVFDLSINDNHQQYELMHRIWEINQLIDDLEQQVQSLEDDDDRESFLQPIQRFRNAVPIAAASNTNIQQAFGPITDGDMIVLDFCSRHLHKRTPEPVADPKGLEDLNGEIDRLFEKVNSSSTLEAGLKEFLLVQIESIRRGIQEYRIGGIQRLRETLGSVLGTAMVNQEKMTADAEELREFIEVTSKLISIVEFAWKTTKLLNAVSAVLPHLLASHQ